MKAAFDLEQAWVGLKRSVEILALELTNELEEGGLPGYVLSADGELNGQAARQSAARAFKAIVFEHGQPANSSLWAIGAIMCGPKTLDLAARANEAKRGFRSAAAVARRKVDRNSRGHEATVYDIVMDAVTGGRVHYKQAVRSIPIIEHATVETVGWSFTRSPSQIKTTAADVLQLLLEKNESSDTIEDIAAIGAMRPETPLVIKREGSIACAANIRLVTETGTVHRQVKTMLPLLIPGEHMVHYLAPRRPKTEASNRKERSDRLIEAAPFLKTEPVYRYRTQAGKRPGYPALSAICTQLGVPVPADDREIYRLYQTHWDLLRQTPMSGAEADFYASLVRRLA